MVQDCSLVVDVQIVNVDEKCVKETLEMEKVDQLQA